MHYLLCLHSLYGQRDFGLDYIFPEAAWPSASAAGKLAGEVKVLQKKGSVNPFVFVDLRE